MINYKRSICPQNTLLEAGMIKLELKFKDKVLKKIETENPEITIGRSPNTDIQIDNLAVSNQHARLIRQKNHYKIEDLNSTNGTYLNDEKITKSTLKHNDVITVGKHNLIIYYKEEAKKPAQDFGDKTVKVKI
jgi:pSer/pThr/pTyr-binding forkhead associated (FHA) protein